MICHLTHNPLSVNFLLQQIKYCVTFRLLSQQPFGTPPFFFGYVSRAYSNVVPFA